MSKDWPAPNRIPERKLPRLEQTAMCLNFDNTSLKLEPPICNESLSTVYQTSTTEIKQHT